MKLSTLLVVAPCRLSASADRGECAACACKPLRIKAAPDRLCYYERSWSRQLGRAQSEFNVAARRNHSRLRRYRRCSSRYSTSSCLVGQYRSGIARSCNCATYRLYFLSIIKRARIPRLPERSSRRWTRLIFFFLAFRGAKRVRSPSAFRFS